MAEPAEEAQTDTDEQGQDDGLFQRGLERYRTIAAPQQEERALSLQDRRFVNIAGAQWEGDWGEGRDLTPAKTEARAKDCSKGGLGCPPTDRRQYYDQRTARYYYFDPQTGRYYWENGDPRF